MQSKDVGKDLGRFLEMITHNQVEDAQDNEDYTNDGWEV